MKKKIEDYEEEVLIYGKEILEFDNVLIQKTFIQHGTVSVYEHSFTVACNCLKLADRFRIKIDRKVLVRGALLHDYFLYDWHEKDKSHKWHGFIHAKRALTNAERDFELNDIEKNMIYTHMFPMNIRIPKYKESIILCISDKICATKETIKRKKRK